MEKSIRPKVVISKCLGFEACRYNGEMISDNFVKSLEPFVEFIFVCPEVEIGLGTPRAPVKLVSTNINPADCSLIQPATDRDLSVKMKSFSKTFFKSLSDIDGFILKSASPSCGVKDARYYKTKEKGPAFKKGPGMFASAVLKEFPDTVIEDEGRLTNLHLREHFLTRIFTFTRFKILKKSPSMHKMVQFQKTHKLLLLSYNQKELKNLGKIVANHDKEPLKNIIELYERHLSKALTRVPRRRSNINVLMHALGYVSPQLISSEKAFFLDILERYRKHQVPLSTPIEVLQSWLIRFDVQYLLNQAYFEPFPQDLISLQDSAKSHRKI